MDRRTNAFSKYLYLFVPSGLSILLGGIVMAVVLILHLSAAIRQAVGIPEGIDLHSMMNNAVETLLNQSLGQSLTGTLVIALFWAFVGLLVYFVVLGIAHFVREVDEDVREEKTFLWPKGANRDMPVREFLLRLSLRAITLGLTVFYVLFPLSFILRAPLFGNTTGVDSTANSFETYVVWFVTGIVVWQGLTILLRLLALRNRLLG